MIFSNTTKKVLSGAIVVFIIFMIYLAINSRSPCSVVNSVDTSIQILDAGKVIGFNTETDSLKFGKVSPGSTVKRSIEVNYKNSAVVKIFMEGSFTSWVTAIPNDFPVEANELKKISFEANIPEDAEPGNYDGKIYFCFSDA